MARYDGAWLVRLEGHPEVSTDDLTLDELETVERVCQVAYSILDPHASVRIAKALLAVMLKRANLAAGMAEQQAEDEALKAAGAITWRKLHKAFTWLPPESSTPPAAGGAPVPPSPAPTSEAG